MTPDPIARSSGNDLRQGLHLLDVAARKLNTANQQERNDLVLRSIPYLTRALAACEAGSDSLPIAELGGALRNIALLADADAKLKSERLAIRDSALIAACAELVLCVSQRAMEAASQSQRFSM